MLLRSTIAILSLGAAGIAPAAPGPAERVEHGLLPMATIVGESARPMILAERMKHHDVPALSFAVIEGGRVAWAKAYGTLASSSDKAATARTLFQAGSLSKPVSAAAALALARRGTLSLDGPLSKQLGNWSLNAAPGVEVSDVTLRRVLSHTAGFTVHGFRGYSAKESLPTLVQVLNGAKPANSPKIEIDQQPGRALRYSGGGYVVLQRAIEGATNAPFDAAVRDLVFRPIGMADSRFSQSPTNVSNSVAIGHLGGNEAVEGGWHRFAELAPAGLWTTPTDLARFMAWVMEGVNGKGSPAQRAIAAHMAEPQQDLDGQPFKTPNGNRAGLGLVIEGEGKASRLTHSGTNVGYKAIMVGFPQTGQGAVIMANSNSSGELIKEVLRSIAAEYRWPAAYHEVVRPAQLDAATLESITGSYLFESRELKGKMLELRVRSSDGALHIALPDGSDRRIHPLSTSEFLDAQSGLKILFEGAHMLKIPEFGITAKRK